MPIEIPHRPSQWIGQDSICVKYPASQRRAQASHGRHANAQWKAEKRETAAR